MRNDFAILILTHGRANEIKTIGAIEKSNYTGKYYIVIDDEDEQEQFYRQRFGNRVYQFCKRDVAKWTDTADNLDNRKAIVFARNISFYIAKELGLKYFMMLDDDYLSFNSWTTNKDFTIKHEIPITDLDYCINMAIHFLDSTNALSVAFAQGGDWIGGAQSTYAKKIVRRKCMNTFICRTDRPFKFFGRFNEDVSAYVYNAIVGNLMWTILPIYIHQVQSQSMSGGMTEEYLSSGTYHKSFSSILYCPSAVKISVIASHTKERAGHTRIHHLVNWKYAAVKIINERYKKQ